LHQDSNSKPRALQPGAFILKPRRGRGFPAHALAALRGKRKKRKKMGMMIINRRRKIHQKLKPWAMKHTSYLEFNGNRKNRKKKGKIMIRGSRIMRNHQKNSCVI
jgi:hypothetical protein